MVQTLRSCSINLLTSGQQQELLIHQLLVKLRVLRAKRVAYRVNSRLNLRAENVLLRALDRLQREILGKHVQIEVASGLTKWIGACYVQVAPMTVGAVQLGCLQPHVGVSVYRLAGRGSTAHH